MRAAPDSAPMMRSSKKTRRPIATCCARLELVACNSICSKPPPEESLLLVARARDLARRLEFWMESGDRRYVYWIERRGRGTFLQATPIDVSQLLDERLFDSVDYVVLTSATLAVAGEFDYTKERLGLRNARTLIVPSHFDYPKQALLYVPQSLPDPRSSRIYRRGRRRDHRTADAQPRPSLRAVHQLSADAPDLRPRFSRRPVSNPAARHRPAQRAARGIPLHPQRRPLRDLVLLARRGRPGRSIELRYHR